MRVGQQHVGDLAHLGARAHRAGRIVGEVQHHPLGLGRDRGLEVDGAQLEVVVLRARHRHRRGARERRLVGIGDPARRGDDHLVARVNARHQRVVHDLLAAVGDHDLLQRIVEIVVALELALDRLLQGLDAVLRRILGLAGQGRLVRRLDGVRRRREVGLARREADDLHALGAQLAHLAGHGGGGGYLDVAQALGDFEHDLLQPFFRIVSAMPPRIAAEARSSRGVIGSASSIAPPMAAMAGTLSWIVAAEVALSAGRAAYHST